MNGGGGILAAATDVARMENHVAECTVEAGMGPQAVVASLVAGC